MWLTFAFHTHALDLTFYVAGSRRIPIIFLHEVDRIHVARLFYIQIAAASDLQRTIDGLPIFHQPEERIMRLFRLPADQVDYASLQTQSLDLTFRSAAA